MNEIRYYIDEHIAKAVTSSLRQRGVDVLTTPETKNLNANDERQLAFALAEGRVIFTQYDGFLKLTAFGKPHAGIVYAPHQSRIHAIIQELTLIHQVLCRFLTEDDEKYLHRVERCELSSGASEP